MLLVLLLYSILGIFSAGLPAGDKLIKNSGCRGGAPRTPPGSAGLPAGDKLMVFWGKRREKERKKGKKSKTTGGGIRVKFPVMMMTDLKKQPEFLMSLSPAGGRRKIINEFIMIDPITGR